MTIQAIFLLQFGASLLVFGLLTKWLLLPRLSQMSQQQVLFWLTLPHAFRYIGMVFLVPGVVGTLPDSFAQPAAYGDLLAGGLALLALVALHYGSKMALGAVWVFNIVGSIDLLYALSQQAVVSQLGAAWFIPTMLVPLLLITHFMIFATLLRRAGAASKPLAAG